MQGPFVMPAKAVHFLERPFEDPASLYDPKHTVRGETVLQAAVLQQAVTDYITGKREGFTSEDVESAHAYLFEDGGQAPFDLETACTLLATSKDSVRRMVMQELARSKSASRMRRVAG